MVYSQKNPLLVQLSQALGVQVFQLGTEPEGAGWAFWLVHNAQGDAPIVTRTYDHLPSDSDLSEVFREVIDNAYSISQESPESRIEKAVTLLRTSA